MSDGLTKKHSQKLAMAQINRLLIASIADKTAFHLNLAQYGTNNSMGQGITPPTKWW